MRRLLIGSLPRILLLGMVAMSLQRVLFAKRPIADVKLQFVLALAVAAGATGGADRGAIAGFTLGLMYDLAGTPAGPDGVVLRHRRHRRRLLQHVHPQMRSGGCCRCMRSPGRWSARPAFR